MAKVFVSIADDLATFQIKITKKQLTFLALVFWRIKVNERQKVMLGNYY